MIVKCPVCYGDGCTFCGGEGELDSTLTVWGHLQDTPLQRHYFPTGQFHAYWGSFLEKLGRRILREELSDDFFEELFPVLEVISSDKIAPTKRGRIWKRKGINLTVDYAVILHCKISPEKFEKNAVLFEIKSSISPINARHINKWTDIISRPGEHIKKCHAIRLFIMWIHGFDVESRNLFWTFKEFKPSEIPNHFNRAQEEEK